MNGVESKRDIVSTMALATPAASSAVPGAPSSDSVYYIILRDISAEELLKQTGHGIPARKRVQCGEIGAVPRGEKLGARAGVGSILIDISGELESQDIVCVPFSFAKRLPGDCAEFLLAIGEKKKRYEFMQTADKLDSVRTIRPGHTCSIACVKPYSGFNVFRKSMEHYAGVVRSCGPRPGQRGTWFEVEVLVGRG